MKDFSKSLLNSDDRTVEAHVVLTIMGVFVFIALAAYSVVWLGHPFEPAAYGEGLGATFVGTGAAAWATGRQRQMQASAIEGGTNGTNNAS